MLNKSYYVQSYLPPSFYTAFGLTFATLIFALLAFLSPYWIESYAIVHSEFVRIGIWMVCFDGFIHPQDYNVRVFTGCIWMYDEVLGDMWFYINPWWLVAVQVLLTVSVLLHFACFLAYCAYYWYKLVRIDYRVCLTTMCALSQAIASLCWAVSIIIYGVESQNRLWIPRPDQNLISWAYWSATITCACAICSAIAAFFQTRELNMLKIEEERARAQLQDDPYLNASGAQGWQFAVDAADGNHQTGVLDIGALPNDYEKDSHGVFLQDPVVTAEMQYPATNMQVSLPSMSNAAI